ncbi:MAG: acetyl-CoA carboxylase biotin carboxyl carrier protein [Planctomycetota bacterium]
MIDPSKLKELVQLMVDNDLSELDLRDQTEKVTIRRGPSGVVQTFSPGYPAQQMFQAPQAAGAPAAPAAGGAAAAAADAGEAGLLAIESPMVGTFYAAPNPESAPFVKAGTPVSADTVVCIIEAMKVFNEIKGAKAGKVERVLVKSGDAVEFGQKLFLVRP